MFNKLRKQLIIVFSVLVILLGNQIIVFAQNVITSNNILFGKAVFVYKPQRQSSSRRKKPSANLTKKTSKPVNNKRSSATSNKKENSASVVTVEPIAPQDWINEQADNAIEERKVSDSEPFLSLTEGFLNSRAYFCESPQYPVVARKTKQPVVKSKVLVTVGQYGGILDASAIEGDDNFRSSVYRTLGSMNFRQSYFMGKLIRIEGLVYFTQNPQNTILCRETSQEVEVPAIIDGGDLTGLSKTCDTPEFPSDAKTAGLNKVEAKIQVIIDEQGKVIQADSVSGHKTFSEAAVNSALKTTFPKSIIAGTPVKVKGFLIFNQNPNNDIRCVSSETK